MFVIPVTFGGGALLILLIFLAGLVPEVYAFLATVLKIFAGILFSILCVATVLGIRDGLRKRKLRARKNY